MPTKEEVAVLKEQALRNIQDHQDIKSEIIEVKTGIQNITTKLDNVITSKADKTDLITLDNRTWGLVLGLLMLLIGVIATWFKR